MGRTEHLATFPLTDKMSFRDALTVISRTITSVSTITSPQQRQGDMSQVGLQRNPSDWLVGDKVNVARETLDAGGMTVGYVVEFIRLRWMFFTLPMNTTIKVGQMRKKKRT